jgi:hypothetical protein
MTRVVWEAERRDWSPVPTTIYHRSGGQWLARHIEHVTPYGRYFDGRGGVALVRLLAYLLGVEEAEVGEITKFVRTVARESDRPVCVTGPRDWAIVSYDTTSRRYRVIVRSL